MAGTMRPSLYVSACLAVESRELREAWAALGGLCRALSSLLPGPETGKGFNSAQGPSVCLNEGPSH